MITIEKIIAAAISDGDPIKIGAGMMTACGHAGRMAKDILPNAGGGSHG